MDDTQPICGYPSKRALLEDLYVKEGLSIAQIAGRLEVGTATVERWLRLLEIPRRPRGGDNSTSRLGWTLHRLDPRVVFTHTTARIVEFTGASPSFIWKFRKGVTAIWNSV